MVSYNWNLNDDCQTTQVAQIDVIGGWGMMYVFHILHRHDQ
jgi:hypothetical protein